MAKWQPKKISDKIDKSKKEAAAEQTHSAADKLQEKQSEQDVSEARRRSPDPVLSHSTKQVVDKCVKSNTILKLSAESTDKGLDKVLVSLHFCHLSIEAAPSSTKKAVILAPTVPLIRQHFDAAKKQPGIRAQYVIGDSSVDAWERREWQDVVERNDLLLITPMLFLDALSAEHLWMGQFCALAFDECQHCVGSHPYSKILSKYYALAPAGSIRILGLCTQLVKRKVKDDSEKKAAVKRLEKALCAPVRDAADLLAASGTEQILQRTPPGNLGAQVLYIQVQIRPVLELNQEQPELNQCLSRCRSSACVRHPSFL